MKRHNVSAVKSFARTAAQPRRFCYAVRRRVIDAVSAADERYSLGPCWEMDYNIRAARAGWRGV